MSAPMREPSVDGHPAARVSSKNEDVLLDEKHENPHHIDAANSKVLADSDLMNDAFDGENEEHNQSLWSAVKTHPKACFWAFIMCFTIVMESFDMFLNGNFVAQRAFQMRYGVQTGPDTYVIETKWQSALFQAGQCGAFVGVFLAGPVVNRLGYRWATMVALVLMNATIFISFFAQSLEVLTVGQALEGIPWGFFIAIGPAYASEIVPLALRGACTATLQMSWSIGSIIVAGATLGYNKRMDEWAWRAPLALQWIFPTPLMVILFFAPESPWWLIRRGRKEEALRSARRLGPTGGTTQQAQRKLAMIERTVEIEAQIGGSPTLLDLFKGVDLRRTTITCLMYASQNFAGNLIANQATFFFEQAGMSHDRAFDLNLINSCLQLFANGLSWPLTAWFGRRTIYLWGTVTNVTLLMILGICASIEQTVATNYAQAVLGILISFVFAGTLGPISYTIIAETSAVRLRALSTAVGRAAYYVAEIPMIYLASQMLNPTGWNLAGKCGYVWGGTAIVCWIMAFFFLPELKHRSYREADILFNRKISARKFKSTVIKVTDNE
ncbi:General alpha-glucoside permease [Colletotrichum sidae]|uniref:General alpha-glucoside permease n=1 Tax=Colletotrichum sidae TaxID=1347389 RepID=A0A4R8TUU8_9PEZI|nr:General alpha-glucoside permease [Colletotrichum sidae]